MRQRIEVAILVALLMLCAGRSADAALVSGDGLELVS